MKNIRKSIKIYEYLAFIIFAAIALLPLLLSAFYGLKNVSASPIKYIEMIIPSGRKGVLLAKSTGYALAVSSITLMVGGWCGVVLFSVKSNLMRSLRWLVLLTALIPPYIHALAWSDVLNLINKRLGFNISITGWGISILTQSMHFLPVAIIFTMIALKSVRADIIDAGRIFHSEGTVFLKIVLPMILPVMLISSGIIFILSLTDYTIPSLFGINIYSMEIFTQFSAGGNPGDAFIIALPVLIITILIIMGLKGFIKSFLSGVLRSSDMSSTGLKFGSATEYPAALAVMVVIVQIAVPACVITFDTSMWTDLFKTISGSMSEISYSLIISMTAVLVSIPVSLVIANYISEAGLSGKIVMLFNIILFTVPSSLVGISLISLWNSILPDSLYNSLLLPVMSLTARFAPLMVMIISVQSGTIDKTFTEAALLHTSDRLRIFVKTRLNILLPGIIASSVLMFILSMGELGATLLVMPPGASTLTVKIYNYLHYGSTEAVKGLCFIVFIVSLFAGYVVISVSGIIRKSKSGGF